MTALNRKLLRELWHMRGQVLAIAVVIAGGLATLVMSLTSLDSLVVTRDAYYRDYRFGEVFGTAKRAPEILRTTIGAIPGVQHVETRVVGSANLTVPNFADPVTGVLVSLPDGRNSELNRVFLRDGRLPMPERAGEVVVSEAFAQAHGFGIGSGLTAIINGRQQKLEIVGIGLSPEYIYQIRPGDLFPDHARYAVLWMSRGHLATAFDMDGAFNSVVLTLTHDARSLDVIDHLDNLLAPYGGLGAIERKDQLSHRYLKSELDQLEMMATVFPAIFLGVAAFLLNVVTTRLIGTQRDQIAILKAFGYSNRQVGAHYLQLVLLIIALGVFLGLALGLWLGLLMTDIYRTFFRFPFMEFTLRPQTFAIGVLVTTLSGLGGALVALRRAVRLAPAEAMRPEPPPSFRPTLVERLGMQRFFTQPTRMILRNIERRPFKSALSVIGIAMAFGILMVGRFQEGAIDYMLKVQFGFADRADLTVTFFEPTSRRALNELQALPGVINAEAFRSAAVTLRSGNASYRTAIQGFEAGSTLRRVLDDNLRAVPLPGDGVLLNDFLADHLRAQPGDYITVEFLEGRRETRQILVAGIVREFTGVAAYMELEALNRLLREDSISGTWLTVQADQRDAIIAWFKDVPRVAGVTDQMKAVQSFYESMADIVLYFAFVSTLLASSIAFGVVYNSARIALTERSRELASLRVLGFTRGEIAYILLGELALLTIAAIPLGFLIGIGLTYYIVQTLSQELYRIPLVLEPGVFAFATTTIAVSTALSGLIIGRRLYHLDLVAVLKTRE